MKPDRELAKILSNAATKHEEKLASSMKNLDIEALEDLLREGPVEIAEKYEEEKTASISEEDFEIADRMGRELAQGIAKIAFTPGVQGMVGRGMSAMSKMTPMHGMMGGAAIGAAAGAMRNPGLDPNTGAPRSRMGGMLAGAAMGGMAGHMAPGLAGKAMAHPQAGPYLQTGAAMAPAVSAAPVAAAPVAQRAASGATALPKAQVAKPVARSMPQSIARPVLPAMQGPQALQGATSGSALGSAMQAGSPSRGIPGAVAGGKPAAQPQSALHLNEDKRLGDAAKAKTKKPAKKKE